MIFSPTSLEGVWIIEPERREDDRGFFARTWCQREFLEHGLDGRLVQCSISWNAARGTLRGMHWSVPPAAETKLVRCTAGAIHDVVVDLRPGSPTYLSHVSMVLSAEARNAVYIPEHCAHGFQTLEPESEVYYQMTEFYEPSAARGARWDDPKFGIVWPDGPRVMSPRDATWPDFIPGGTPAAGGAARRGERV